MSGLDGHCLCGSVTIRVGRHEPEVHACHCVMCRRWSGSVYMMFRADPEDVRIDGPARRYRSSSFAERGFCGTCGSHLWLRDEGASYEFMPGLFPGAAGFPLVSEIYIDHALAAVSLSGDHRTVTRADYEAEHPFVSEEDLP